MSIPERASCPVCGREMDSILRYDEAHWFCNAHGDFPNTAFETDAAKLDPTYRDVGSWVEAKAVSLLVSSVRVFDANHTIEE